MSYDSAFSDLISNRNQKREDNDNDNEMDVNMDKEPRIGRWLNPYLDYLSEDNPTTSNYDKMVLARAIAEDLSSTFDRIDKCGE
jgi:hypothetical protein